MDTNITKAIENQKFSMEDIRPEDSKVVLNGKEYEMKKITLDDEIWIKKNFGDAQKLMNNEDLDFMGKLCFRLLKDKSDFLPIDEESYDDDGNKKTVRVTGPQRVLRALEGPKQKYDFIQSICVTFGISRPVFDKMVAEALGKSEAQAVSK